MSDPTKARKHSKKGIKTTPKTFRQFKSAVNKLAWRKYHQTRDSLGLSINDLKVAYATEITPLAFVEKVCS